MSRTRNSRQIFSWVRIALLLLLAVSSYWLREHTTWFNAIITASLAILAFIVIPVIEMKLTRLPTIRQRWVDINQRTGIPKDDGILLKNQTSDKMKQFGFNQLSEYEQTLLCVDWLETAVHSDGLEEYLLSEAGTYAPETVEALKRIGAKKTAKFLQEIIDRFPNSQVPKDADERQKAVEWILFNEPYIFYQFDQWFIIGPEYHGLLLRKYLSKTMGRSSL